MNPDASPLASGPAFLFLAHMVCAGLTWGLRRRPAYAALTGLCALLLIMLGLAVVHQGAAPANLAWRATWEMPRMGLALALEPSVAPHLIFLHALVAAVFLLTLWPRSGVHYLPGLVLLLAGYSLAVMLAEGPLLAPFLLPLCLVPLTAWSPSIHTPRGAAFRRVVLAPLIAAPCFVLGHWLLFAQMPLDPQNEALAQRAHVLLAAGLFLLCLPFPLYSLLRNDADGAAALPNAAADLLYQFAALVALHAVVQIHPALLDFEPLFVWLGWASVITVIWSGLAAFGTQNPERIWFYAGMLNWGMILLAFTLPLTAVWETMLILFLLRCACLLAGLAGFARLDESRMRLEAGWSGLGNSQPWNMALFLFGALGLVGFPLTSGFGPFWITWQFIATIDWQVALILAVGTVLTAVGFIRVLRILLRPAADRPPVPEPPAQKLQAAALLGLLVYLSFVPQALTPFLDALIRHFQ